MGKINLDEIKRKYIDAAILQKQSSINGDYKTANKQYDVLKKIFDKIQGGHVSMDVLIELLEHENDIVKACAAANLLALNYEITKAEQELARIASVHSSDMIGFSAEMCLKIWKEQGYLKF